jgi:hypothetical protein
MIQLPNAAALAAALMSTSLAVCAVAPAAARAAASGPGIEETVPGTAWIAVVTEGAGEPRSVGSYGLRMYARSESGGTRDQFVAGTIRPRDGTIEAIRFVDLDRDGAPELVVMIRSVGTGGYLSADAYRLRGGAPRFAASVEGLPKDEDPMPALRAKLRPRAR